MKNPFRRVNTSTPYALTESGKLKTESGVSVSEMLKVLTALDENGSSTSKEIADDTGMRSDRVLKILQRLEKGGYVRHLAKNELED